MDIVGAVESKFKTALDEAAFDINITVKSQEQENSVSRLYEAVRKYQNARQCLQLCQEIRTHLQGSNPEAKQQDEKQDNTTSS
tara:strand:+ start:216 stop:464 length:249 start_codon:yes stop_codon:yes gene_type:complete